MFPYPKNINPTQNSHIYNPQTSINNYTTMKNWISRSQNKPDKAQETVSQPFNSFLDVVQGSCTFPFQANLH